MNEFIWNGEMDCGLEDLAEMLKIESKKYADIMLKTVSISPVQEAINLISKESMERLCLLAEHLSIVFQEGQYYQCEDLDSNQQNASRLISWIILGSLTETVLQMFLAFYIEDYKESQWQQWIDFPSNEVKEKVRSAITNLVEKETISQQQGKSLNEAIKSTIKKHTVEHPIQKVMFDELIQFYTSENLLDKDEISYLKTIQSNRNGIHLFENRIIGNWSDLQYAVRFWCYLLQWVQFRLPDIPDYE